MSNKLVVITGGAVICVLMICVTVLAALHADTNSILAVMSTIIVPGLTILGYRELRGIKESTDQVQRNTNGSNAQLQQQVVDMHNQIVKVLSQLGPLPLAVPAIADSPATQPVVDVQPSEIK